MEPEEDQKPDIKPVLIPISKQNGVKSVKVEKNLQNPILQRRLQQKKPSTTPQNQILKQHLQQKVIPKRVPQGPSNLYTPENTVKCGRCPRIFLSNEELQEHRYVHYHKCKKCNDRFPELKDLQEHMASTHKQERSSTTAKCNQCDEIFSSVQELLVHSLTHTKTMMPKNRNMKCGECNREFQKPSQLRNHLYVHLPEAERPHKCNECGKSFATTSILKKHKIIHQPKAHQW